jgi:hypothetical protein
MRLSVPEFAYIFRAIPIGLGSLAIVPKAIIRGFAGRKLALT